MCTLLCSVQCTLLSVDLVLFGTCSACALSLNKLILKWLHFLSLFFFVLLDYFSGINLHQVRPAPQRRISGYCYSRIITIIRILYQMVFGSTVYFVYECWRMDYHRKRRSKSERDKLRKADSLTKVLLCLLEYLVEMLLITSCITGSIFYCYSYFNTYNS